MIYADTLPMGMFPHCRRGERCDTRFGFEPKASRAYYRTAIITLGTSSCHRTVQDAVRVISRTGPSWYGTNEHFGVIGMRTLRALRASIWPPGIGCPPEGLAPVPQRSGAIPCSATPNEGICAWTTVCPPDSADANDPRCQKAKAMLDSGAEQTMVDETLARRVLFPQPGRTTPPALRPGDNAYAEATIALLGEQCGPPWQTTVAVMPSTERTRLLDVDVIIGRDLMNPRRVRLDPWTDPPSFHCAD